MYDKFLGLALTNGVTVAVQVVNFVLKKLIQSLVNNIGYDTDSERIMSIMTFTFYSQFINTGIIPLLTNANLSYTRFFNIIPLRM